MKEKRKMGGREVTSCSPVLIENCNELRPQRLGFYLPGKGLNKPRGQILGHSWPHAANGYTEPWLLLMDAVSTSDQT